MVVPLSCRSSEMDTEMAVTGACLQPNVACDALAWVTAVS